jgi:hypothetical protein
MFNADLETMMDDPNYPCPGRVSPPPPPFSLHLGQYSVSR